MPKKIIKKKKAYKEFCRHQVVVKGLINTPSGDWRPIGSSAIDQMYLAGYKGK